jgi:anaerobic selenocysteine-containing dehydrogenase
MARKATVALQRGVVFRVHTSKAAFTHSSYCAGESVLGLGHIFGEWGGLPAPNTTIWYSRLPVAQGHH